ncbi:uncharacterized protein LOC124554202 [Schistocerca americana]|uniref:uncharacterized protein LOC124554202 n=1 Tax=Schistocerca americana TaxID=7009 RepID=UPI001F4F1B29|nr:uncharacterized protein LOC124554202 [Schistocerca americana]
MDPEMLVQLVLLAATALLVPRPATGGAVISSSPGWRPIPDPSPGIGLTLGSAAPAVSYQNLVNKISTLDGPEGISSPLYGASQGFGEADGGQCALYKVTFTQDLYFQYIQYKADIPDIQQFTLCAWTKFTNHSNDHPIFSYAVPNQPRAIYVWVSSTQRSNYWQMSVNGHTFYRLNYPLRLHRWYHSCASWNSQTGEFQLWVNDERVGRGFHNRLVGYTIPGGGVAITGQEQRQPGGGFLEGPGAPLGSGGMLGEVTMVYLFGAALAAGKAHRDHKHHHGNHHEDYPANGQSPASATPPPPPPPPPQFMHPLLVAGQIAPRGQNVIQQIEGSRPRLPEQPQQQQQILSGSIFGVDGLGLGGDSFLSNKAFEGSLLEGGAVSSHKLFKRQQEHQALHGDSDDQRLELEEGRSTTRRSRELHVAPVSEDPEDEYTTPRYKAKMPLKLSKKLWATSRTSSSAEEAPTSKADSSTESVDSEPATSSPVKKVADRARKSPVTKRATNEPKAPAEASDLEEELLAEADGDAKNSRTSKRGALLPSDDLFLSSSASLLSQPSSSPVLSGSFAFSKLPVEAAPLLLQPGTPPPLLEPEAEPYPREPAEGEVAEVMRVCSGCDPEPFKAAAIISWRATPKKVYSGALYSLANPECRKF